MADNVDVRLYVDHVVIVVSEATAEVLRMAAMRVVEHTQLNIRNNGQIDTGFMVNSVYPVWGDGSGYSEAAQAAATQTTNRDGQSIDHASDMAPEIGLPDDAGAAVVVGAVYAIYQEASKPFLYPAGQSVAAEFGGTAEQIYRENLPDEGIRP